jgi:hypothetical protein
MTVSSFRMVLVWCKSFEIKWLERFWMKKSARGVVLLQNVAFCCKRAVRFALFGSKMGFGLDRINMAVASVCNIKSLVMGSSVKIS